MVRIIIWGTLFVIGAWAGAEYERTVQIDRCLDAGGAIDGRGLCLGLRADG